MSEVGRLIEEAQADLVRTTISGSAWARTRGPGLWRKAFAKLEQAKNLAAAEQPPLPPPPLPPPPLPSPPVVGVPPAIAGWRVDLDETFATLDRTRWHKIWWQPEPRPDQARIVDGHLRLSTYRRDETVDETGAIRRPWVGLCTKPYDVMEGVWTPPVAFEVRFRWTGGKGSWPAIYAFSAANAKHFEGSMPPWTTLCAEVDMFEGHGNPARSPGMAMPGPYYAPWAFHRNTSGLVMGIPNETRGEWWTPPQPLSYRLDDGAPHTVIGQIGAAETLFYLDGLLLGRVPNFDSTVQPLMLILEIEAGDGGWGDGGVDASTPDEIFLDVDRVRVFRP